MLMKIFSMHCIMLFVLFVGVACLPCLPCQVSTRLVVLYIHTAAVAGFSLIPFSLRRPRFDWCVRAPMDDIRAIRVIGTYEGGRKTEIGLLYPQNVVAALDMQTKFLKMMDGWHSQNMFPIPCREGKFLRLEVRLVIFEASYLFITSEPPPFPSSRQLQNPVRAYLVCVL